MPSEMEDGGRYSQNNHMTFTVSKFVKSSLTQGVAASMNKVKESSQFTYCDFGAADGGMASVLAKTVVDEVLANDKRKNVNVFFEDRPTNDFSSLFTKFQHQIADSSAMESVFVSAVGRSFYKQCLPEESVDLALCSTAAHWLDINEHTDPDVFDKVKNAFWICNRTHSFNGFLANESHERAMKVCGAKAAADWERFLLMRANELKAGGRCIVANIGRGTPGGQGRLDKIFQPFSKVIGHDFVDTLHQLVKEGILTEDEGRSINCPAYGRTIEEHKAPFVDPDSPVRKAGLKLAHIEPLCVPCPNEKLYLSGGLTKAEYAKKTSTSFRTWSYYLVYDGLSRSRSEAEKQRLIDTVYDRFAERLASGSSPPSFPYAMVLSVIEKCSPETE